MEDASLADSRQSRDLSGAVIVESVHCRQCGYNLRGLSPAGRCPECGLDTWETILHTVDPGASRLPRLRNPKAVGDGLLCLTVCALVSTALMMVGPAGRELNLWTSYHWSFLWIDVPGDLPLVAGIVAMAGLWGPWKLMPPTGQELRGPVRRDVWLVAWGFLLLGFLSIALWMVQEFWPSAVRPVIIGRDFEVARRTLMQLLMFVSAVIGFIGLRGVFQTIGLRSRAYRDARGGRQRVRDMIIAALLAATGLVVRWAGLSLRPHTGLATWGSVIFGASMFMLLIGLVYLVVNAGWIRRSLLRPPPQLDELIQWPDKPGPSEPR